MSERVDFHVHSDRSCDGDFNPEELIRMARDKGFRAISIADHDTVAAYPEALEFGRKFGVEVIPNIEVTTLYGGREFHLLLPFVDHDSRAVREIIEGQTVCRMEEAKERVGKLEKLGFAVGWEEVKAKSNGVPPLGVKIAQILLDSPANAGRESLEYFHRQENRATGPYLFYREYFAEGKPAYVPKKYIGLLEVLRMAPETGGVPVLAHPGAYFQRTTREDARALKKEGLVGLEVYTFYHTAEQVDFYRTLAGELDLVPTAGSDFHGKIKPHVAFGGLSEGEYWMVERLRAARARKDGR
jgi:predicted metal-dependent phosphoesterase TrpH